MTDMQDPKDVETRLWKEVEKGRYGMLGVMDAPHQHFQPMTAFAEPEAGHIWFFTRKDTDLARRLQSGRVHAMFVVQTRDQDLQACIGGHLSLDHDADRIDRFWNVVVAAWYPEGKTDPGLTLLRMDCEDAQVWLSEAGPVKFAFEIAKAHTTHKKPDLGDRSSINLGHGSPPQN